MSRHIILISLTWLSWTAQALDSNIHTSMNSADLRAVFHVEHIDDVPSYQVVPLTEQNDDSRRSKRETASSSDDDGGGTRKLRLEAFGNRLDLVLKPTKGLFRGDKIRMWNAVADANSTDGMEYQEIVEEDSEPLGEIYQDENNMAAFLIRRDEENGGLIVEGSVGEDLVIRPLPVAYRNISNYDSHHVVIKRDTTQKESAGDFDYMEPDRLHKRYTRAIRSKRSAPYIIYPEILVIVDYDGYRLHGGDNLQVKRYFVSFWNGVDLRYRLLKGPRVRISIAGIIISRGRDATPYLERNRVGRDAIDSAAALTDMGKYLFRERRLPVYDIAVAITKLDMCRRQYANDACNRGTAGFAYVGGACVVNKRLEKVNSVAIIEDTGGFSGIIVAAHEVGHLLGAVHDGSPPPSYLGGPGAEKCRWEDGYIMSDLRHTERGFRWSPCSVQSFHHFLNGDTASCLHNPPHEDEALARALPGTLLSLDAQCRRDRGTSACFKDERVCSQLFCFDAASGYCVAYRPAAEGSPCGDGQHCLDGRCVAEHENIIPDYSQHTPSYVRPQTSPQYRSTTEAYRPQYTNPPQTTRSYLSFFQNIQTTETPTTLNPYAFYPQQYSTTTRRPTVFNFHQYNPTTKSPYFKYQPSTTRSPYNFHNFGQPVQPIQPRPVQPSRNEAYENYLKRLAISTTRNPYDFANFGKSYTKATPRPTGGQYGNYLKRSFDTHAFWDSSATNQRNETRTAITT